MQVRWSLLSLVFMIAAGATPAQEKGVHVAGRIVGADGAPAPGVRVGPYWSFDEGKPSGSRLLRAGDDGRFDGAIEYLRVPGLLVAYSDDGAMVGTAELADQDALEDVAIQLAPSVRVHGRFVSPKLDGPIPWTNVYFYSGKNRPWSCSSQKAEFDVRLPRGELSIYAYGTDVNTVRRPLVLDGDAADVDLGEIELPATYLALHRGQRIDDVWKVTAARGMPLEQAQDLAKLRGKWLYIEFWGFW